MKKKVLVRYYAVLREQRGLAEETVETSASTAAELYRELGAMHSLEFPAERLRVAVNDDFRPWDSAVQDGDLLAFIPPFSGG